MKFKIVETVAINRKDSKGKDNKVIINKSDLKPSDVLWLDEDEELTREPVVLKRKPGSKK